MQKVKGYFSEEELEKLIADVELNHMLEAPTGMKDSIMSKAREENILNIRKSTKTSAKMQLIKYQIKVGIATAAALLILFVAPLEISMAGSNISSAESYSKNYQSFTSKIARKSDQLCEKFFDFTNQLISKEDIGYEKTEKK